MAGSSSNGDKITPNDRGQGIFKVPYISSSIFHAHSHPHTAATTPHLTSPLTSFHLDRGSACTPQILLSSYDAPSIITARRLMPLKPLQRLALRPAVVTRASSLQQPWHNNNTTIFSRGLHASTCRHLRESRGSQQRQQRLFDELFPKKEQQARTPSPPFGTFKPDSTGNNKSTQPRWASQISDELPPLAPSEELRRLSELSEDYDQGDETDFLNGAQQSSSSSASSDSNPALRATTMLILNAASKQLVESDFLRIGAKGQHVPGWVSGIVRVIQGRDHATLEPLGHYFILFDRHEAAVAYAEEVHRLRDLSRQYTPGASHAARHEQRRHGLPEGLPTDTGEDVATLIKSFTLVPPTQPPRLRISERLADDHISDLDRGGALVDNIVRALGGHRNLVMVHVADGGRIPVEMLRQAIRADGVERGLPWRVVSLERGIWPFGQSVLKPLDELAQQDGTGSSKSTTTNPTTSSEAAKTSEEGMDMIDDVDDDVDGVADDNSFSSPGVTVSTTTTKKRKNNTRRGKSRKQRTYPRFLVAFTDEPEAWRFIRHWHRREISPSQVASHASTGPGLPPAAGLGAMAAPWESTWILNVSRLW